MAQIIEEIVTIKVSRIFRDNELNIGPCLLDDEAIQSLRGVAQELVGPTAIVEVIEGQ